MTRTRTTSSFLLFRHTCGAMVEDRKVFVISNLATQPVIPSNLPYSGSGHNTGLITKLLLCKPMNILLPQVKKQRLSNLSFFFFFSSHYFLIFSAVDKHPASPALGSFLYELIYLLPCYHKDKLGKHLISCPIFLSYSPQQLYFSHLFSPLTFIIFYPLPPFRLSALPLVRVCVVCADP